MAKGKGPSYPSADVKELLKDIRTGVDVIKAAKLERESYSEDISAAIERLESKGINRHALRMAMRYAEFDEDVRAGFDVAYQLVREAIGVPFEDQLFDAKGNPRLVVPSAAADPKPEPVKEPDAEEGDPEREDSDPEPAAALH
jgi:hypothetical protein